MNQQDQQTHPPSTDLDPDQYRKDLIEKAIKDLKSNTVIIKKPKQEEIP